MKIQDAMQSLQQVLGKAPASEVGQVRGGSVAPGAEKLPVFGTDHADVSQAAGLLAKAASAPDVRAEKVASIQSALADGSYKVSASEVAASIIDSLKKG
jgi:flagellar biosynthesis anti-sigma factor FlgM